MRKLAGGLVALAAIAASTSAATTAQAGYLRASASYPPATLSGAYTVTYEAAGDVPDRNGSDGTTHATESYSYTVHITRLPIAPHYKHQPDTGFNGAYAEFAESGSRPHAAPYETVSDATFSVDDPESSGPCPTVESIQPTGPAKLEGGLDIIYGLAGTESAGTTISGTWVSMPTQVTGWTFDGGDCYTLPVDMMLSPYADGDDVSIIEEHGRTTDDGTVLGRWDGETGGQDFSSLVQPLFDSVPKTVCTGGLPSSWSTDAGSCTSTDSAAGANATLRATIRWAFHTTGVPKFRERIASGNHQTIRRGRFINKHLVVQVRYPNGHHVYAGAEVFFSAKGPVRLGPDAREVLTDGHGQAEIDNVRAKHRSGRVTITARAENARKPVVFHLVVRR